MLIEKITEEYFEGSENFNSKYFLAFTDKNRGIGYKVSAESLKAFRVGVTYALKDSDLDFEDFYLMVNNYEKEFVQSYSELKFAAPATVLEFVFDLVEAESYEADIAKLRECFKSVSKSDYYKGLFKAAKVDNIY
jgi:hypothetical protein